METYGYDIRLRQKGEFYCFICFSRTIYSDLRTADMMKTWQMEDSHLTCFQEEWQIPSPRLWEDPLWQYKQPKMDYFLRKQASGFGFPWTNQRGQEEWLFSLFLWNFPSSDLTLHPFFTQTTNKLPTSENWRQPKIRTKACRPLPQEQCDHSLRAPLLMVPVDLQAVPVLCIPKRIPFSFTLSSWDFLQLVFFPFSVWVWCFSFPCSQYLIFFFPVTSSVACLNIPFRTAFLPNVLSHWREQHTFCGQLWSMEKTESFPRT